MNPQQNRWKAWGRHGDNFSAGGSIVSWGRAASTGQRIISCWWQWNHINGSKTISLTEKIMFMAAKTRGGKLCLGWATIRSPVSSWPSPKKERSTYQRHPQFLHHSHGGDRDDDDDLNFTNQMQPPQNIWSLLITDGHFPYWAGRPSLLSDRDGRLPEKHHPVRLLKPGLKGESRIGNIFATEFCILH